MNYFDDLEFVCCGHTLASSSECKDYHFDGYYGIQFIIDGKINLSIDNSNKISSQGPVVFITGPNNLFTYNSPKNESRQHFFVCFKGPRVKRYIDGGLFPKVIPNKFFLVQQPQKLADMFFELLSYWRRSDKNSHAEAVLILEKILLQLSFQFGNFRPNVRDKECFSSLAALIAENPAKKWNFDEEADKLGISKVHYRRLFQQETGVTPWRYVLECRMRYASVLLLTTQLRIKEIAFQCGFAGEFHFSREFKKITGLSPRLYRLKR
jgi:AraC-like DNA-binding protein